MGKIIRAVAPIIYPKQINFKQKPFVAWKELGLPIAKAHYPWRPFHRIFYQHTFSTIFTFSGEARLRFVQPQSLYFDTWPDYLFYEIIPFFWDAWPSTFPKVESWLKRYKVKTAIFSSTMAAEHMKHIFPEMNIIWCPEGIDTENYCSGKKLKDRTIDLLQYGREIDSVVNYNCSCLNYVSGKNNGKAIFSLSQLIHSLADAKVVAVYPKAWTNPESAGGMETLTQRFWECMLSRCVLLGHAPFELVDVLGYNPVIELDRTNPQDQLESILLNIDNFQGLVDRNRIEALKRGSWVSRIESIKRSLLEVGYLL